MAKRIARFEKVSEEQYNKDSILAYEDIILPKRATKGSAGYDFFSPVDIILEPECTVRIPMGIRCKMEEDWVLLLVPRSSLGFKYRLQLDNTIGVIDSDYYYAKNEGHIMIKLTNDSKNGDILEIKKGDAIAQGIFVQYGITEDDDVMTERTGGFGSTN
jgi:dUTP pyrophosphatase